MLNFASYDNITTLISEIKQKFNALTGAYIIKGNLSFENLPSPITYDMLGYVYNITNEFTTDNRFVEGVGKKYSAGTNVVIVDLGTISYNLITPDGTENPRSNNWYIINNGEYIETTDETVQTEVNYYEKVITHDYKFDVNSAFVDVDLINSKISNLVNSIADVFDATQAYAIGDIVIYNNKLYKFKVAHIANTDWSASEVDAVTLEELIDNLEDNFVKKGINYLAQNEYIRFYDENDEYGDNENKVIINNERIVVENSDEDISTIISSGQISVANDSNESILRNYQLTIDAQNSDTTFKSTLGTGSLKIQANEHTFEYNGYNDLRVKDDNTNAVSSITPNNIFENGVMLENKYASKSVESLLIDNAAKNLLPLKFSDIKLLNTLGVWQDNVYTYNGLTMTINKNSENNITSIIMNGNATAISYFYLNDFFQLEKGEYIWYSGQNGEVNGVQLYLNNIATGGWQSYKTTLNLNNITNYKVRIYCRENATPNNIIYKPMIRHAEITDDTYEPYYRTQKQLDADLKTLEAYVNTLTDYDSEVF